MRHDRITVTCIQCGRDFLIHYSRVAYGRGKFCSRECQRAQTRVVWVCEGCGLTRTRVRWEAEGKKFCSRACAYAHRELGDKRSYEERIDAKTDRSGECHLWFGAKDPFGYGQIGFQGRIIHVTRLVWMLEHGWDSIPPKMEVCHTCDTPACVRIEHLWLGTHTDNMRDKIAKGRQNIVYGERIGNAILTERQVLEIIRLLDEKAMTAKAIAAMFGTAQTTISAIRNGRTWPHLERPTTLVRRVRRKTRRPEPT